MDWPILMANCNKHMEGMILIQTNSALVSTNLNAHSSYVDQHQSAKF